MLHALQGSAAANCSSSKGGGVHALGGGEEGGLEGKQMGVHALVVKQEEADEGPSVCLPTLVVVKQEEAAGEDAGRLEGLQGRAAATCSSSSSTLHDAFVGAEGTKTGGKVREDNREAEGETEKGPKGGGCHALKGVGGGVLGGEGEGLEGEQMEVAMALKKEGEPRQVLLSFMTSRWIKKPKEWNSWVGLPKELSKRQHEFQALLRLYVVSLMEKKIVDPLEGANIKNVIRYE